MSKARRGTRLKIYLGIFVLAEGLDQILEPGNTHSRSQQETFYCLTRQIDCNSPQLRRKDQLDSAPILLRIDLPSYLRSMNSQHLQGQVSIPGLAC